MKFLEINYEKVCDGLIQGVFEEELNLQIEVVCILVEKFIIENVEFVEKVRCIDMDFIELFV